MVGRWTEIQQNTFTFYKIIQIQLLVKHLLLIFYEYKFY